MSMKDRLTRKHVLLIVLCTVFIITLIAGGSAVYAKYTQTKSAGSGIEVQVETGSKSGLTTEDYNSNIPFDQIPSVYPFG